MIDPNFDVTFQKTRFSTTVTVGFYVLGELVAEKKRRFFNKKAAPKWVHKTISEAV